MSKFKNKTELQSWEDTIWLTILEVVKRKVEEEIIEIKKVIEEENNENNQ